MDGNARAPKPAGGRTFVVCLTGGSGARYGLRLIEVLLEAGANVHFAASSAAFRVLKFEGGIDLYLDNYDACLARFPELFAESLRPRLHLHAARQVEAAPASGSAGIEATVIVPCSMGTLARVAHGFSSNLVERAADVAIKEGRTLVVVPRETPLSAIHLENMLRLTKLGVVVLPAMPGFYHRPETLEDLVDFIVGKILDRLQVQHEVVRRWQTPKRDAVSPFDEEEV